jgi:hypothetical protein
MNSRRFSSRISLRSSNPAITNFSLQQFGDSGEIDRNNVTMDERDPTLNVNQEITSECTRILPPSNQPIIFESGEPTTISSNPIHKVTTPRRSRKKTNVDNGRNNNNNTAFSSSINGNNDQTTTQPCGNGDGFQQQLLTALNSLLQMNRTNNTDIEMRNGVNGSAFHNHNTFHQNNLLKHMKIVKFHGNKDEDFDIWFDDFSNQVSKMKVSERDKLDLFKLNLSGDARIAFEGCKPDQVDTLSKAGFKMRSVFSTVTLAQWSVKLEAIQKEMDEDMQIYGLRVSRLVQRAYPTVDEVSIETLKIDHFLRGLPNDMANKIRIREPTTLEECIRRAIIYEKEITSLPLNRKRKQESLTLMSSSGVDGDKTDNCEFLPKRNGGFQEVTLATLMETIKTNHQQQNQKLSSELGKVTKKLEEQQQQHQQLEQQLKMQQHQQLFLHHLSQPLPIQNQNQQIDRPIIQTNDNQI